MNEQDSSFFEAQREKALYKWKWRNPYLVAFLTFLHPVGMLLSSIPAFFIYLISWLCIWLYWPDRNMVCDFILAATFSAYAYHNTRWKNGAIEKWKYGLPGTGKDNPKKMAIEGTKSG